MNILFASSEVAPFAKTGGLADVCGALPGALAALGHEVAVILPAYKQVKERWPTLEPLNVKFDIPIGSKIVRGRLLRSELPGSGVPVYFVEQDDYFLRAELYRERDEDYRDNCERFVFFCRAVLECIRILQMPVNVVHCHDWQTGLIPAYLQIEYPHAEGYESIASVLTIHNLAYQGVFWHWDMLLTGLDWKFFNWHQMEFWGRLNLLKTGLAFADALTTVSPTYAQEIQTAEQGCGLEGLLQQRSDVLRGIVNGVDYQVWNPATDGELAQCYDASNWTDGKAACKAALQSELSLPLAGRTPIIGLVGRLAMQKGWDLVIDVMRRWVREEDAQWVILGTGDSRYQQALADLAAEYPHRIAARFAFSDPLAHRIEAGADVFLMPSQFEPCGLNQLYSLKYGTVPVVRATGGLVDTVTDTNPETLANRSATGFAFQAFSSGDLEWALRRATDAYRHQPQAWRQLVETGMQQDWSWGQSARKYVQTYQTALERKAVARDRLLAARLVGR